MTNMPNGLHLFSGLLLGIFVLLLAQTGYPQTDGRYKNAIEKSRRAIEKEMAEHRLPGVSVAVAIDGKIVWSEGFGMADLENKLPVTTKTRFRIASTSKPITAAAMARLYEQGRLDIDAPIQRYVPYFPEKTEGAITARRLVGNLSGIRHYRRDPNPELDEFFSRKKYIETTRQAVAEFANDPLDFAPGSKYGYSSYGFTLLSAAIEGASGEEFLAYLQKEIFAPLKMNSTGADINKKIVPNRSSFYSLENKTETINAPYIDYSISWGGGGLISTPEDLVRFGSAHLEPGFLKEATLKEMFTSQRTNDGTATGIGFAWRILNDQKGLRYYHPGEAVGGRSYLIIHPKQKLVISLVHNLTGGSLSAGVKVSDIFVEEIKSSKE